MLAAVLIAVAIARLPAPIHGDFDHDGKLDVAEIVARRDGSYQLVIRRSDRARSVSLIETISANELPSYYVTKGRAGHYRTWCGKGGGSDDDSCPRKSVTLRGDILTFGMQEASESVAIWTGKRFEVVLLSD
jgi:hypothetical protein